MVSEIDFPVLYMSFFVHLINERVGSPFGLSGLFDFESLAIYISKNEI